MPNVFISYGREEGDFADVLRVRIGDAGFTTWIDLEGLQAGEDWRQEIDEAIRESAALIVVLTPATAQSPYVNYEWAFALGAGVRVVPVLLQPTQVHPRLATLQHLDFTRRELRPWNALIDALREAAEKTPAGSIAVPRSAPPVLKEAVAALDHPDRNTMEEAVLRLADMDVPDARAALVDALRHPLPDVRIAAAWQLARRGDVRAVPGLIEGNRRRGWHMEFARRVAGIGPSALPAVVALFDDAEASMRRDALWAAGEIGDATALPDVMRCLDDPDVEVRAAACSALLRFDNAQARAALEATVPRWIEDLRTGVGRTRQEARIVLERIGTEPARAALRDHESVAEGA